MKEYDYFNGAEWVKVNEKWLCGVDLNNLVEVRYAGTDKIECIYKNGQSVYYKDIYGTWGFPCIFNGKKRRF